MILLKLAIRQKGADHARSELARTLYIFPQYCPVQYQLFCYQLNYLQQKKFIFYFESTFTAPASLSFIKTFLKYTKLLARGPQETENTAHLLWYNYPA